MPLPEKFLTIRSLANHLRLSAMTVSRALRNAPGVSTATRTRVLNEAAIQGYRPDPSLAVLNAYRHGRRHLLPHETIGYLSNFPLAEEWRRIEAFLRYFNGAKARATELGYVLEHFWLNEPQLTGRRASQILVNRGIHGLIVGPLDRSRPSLQLDWAKFTAVALGRSLVDPVITTVSTNHFQAVELAWRKCWERGYRRIGLVLTEEEEARTLGTFRASYLLQQHRYACDRIPVLIVPSFRTPALAAWARLHHPDLIISSNHLELLREGLGAAGRGSKFLDLNANPQSEMGGIDQGHDKAGEHAMTTLHLKLIRREAGIPAHRELTLIDGTWKEGRGSWRLPRRTPAGAAKAQPTGFDLRQAGG